MNDLEHAPRIQQPASKTAQAKGDAVSDYKRICKEFVDEMESSWSIQFHGINMLDIYSRALKALNRKPKRIPKNPKERTVIEYVNRSTVVEYMNRNLSTRGDQL